MILASNSPRRRQLLALGGWPFSIQPADIDERELPGEAPENYVLRLAEEKARAADRRIDPRAPEAAVIASDTTVALDGAILGKPADAAEAVDMLARLRGRWHQVFTGIAVLRRADAELRSEVCATDVLMRAYTDAEMRAYAASGDPLDKAGAYAVQHAGFHPVERVRGCYPSVMGLPLCRVTRLLDALGIPAASGLTHACQPDGNQPCEVYLRAGREQD